MTDPTSIDFTGSRATLVANICAVAIAVVVLVEVAIIENARWGYVLPSDPFLCFFPAIVMFVVRSEPFSFVFLFAHAAVSVQLFFTVKDILAGTYRFSRANDPFFCLVLFTMVTIVCLSAYLITVLIRSIGSAFSRK